MFGAIPASVIPALIFSKNFIPWIGGILGVVTVGVVVTKHVLPPDRLILSLRPSPGLGATVGFLSGMGGIVGPAEAPFWTDYGLRKGAYLGTMF